jgi:hypothetical protein
MSEAAAGTIRLQRPAAHARKGRRPLAAEERRGPSDQQADGDADTAAPTQAARQGLAAGCGWPVRTLPGFSRRLPATAPPRAAGLLVAALPLAACTSSKPTEAAQPAQQGGGGSAAPSAAASSIAAPQKASKNYNLQFIQGVAGDEFYITMQCGMEAEAAKLGVSVKSQGPQKFDPTLQSRFSTR